MNVSVRVESVFLFNCSTRTCCSFIFYSGTVVSVFVWKHRKVAVCLHAHSTLVAVNIKNLACFTVQCSVIFHNNLSLHGFEV